MNISLRTPGFVTLLAVSIVFALFLSLSLSVTYLSIDESSAARTLIVGESTLMFVEGCAEDALLKSARDETFSGGSVTFPRGECDVEVEKDGSRWILRIIGLQDGFTRRIEVRIDRTPGNPGAIVLERWQEV